MLASMRIWNWFCFKSCDNFWHCKAVLMQSFLFFGHKLCWILLWLALLFLFGLCVAW